MDYQAIPKKIVQRINHPELLRELSFQNNPESCGTCALKNVLQLDFGYEKSESCLWAMKERVSGKNIGGGTSPEEIAGIAREIGNNGLAKKLKAFTTNHGDVNQLVWFRRHGVTPITHRYWHERGRAGHYDIFLGKNRDNIYLFNSFRNVETSGIYKIDSEEFMNEWWLFGKDNQRSYITIIPESFSVPFRGIYLSNHFKKRR